MQKKNKEKIKENGRQLEEYENKFTSITKKIIGKKVQFNCKEYLIKWKGYSEDEST